MLVRELASFWRENVIVVVILIRVFARLWVWLRRQVIKKVRGLVILRPGEGLTSFNKDNSANFSGEKKCNEGFRGVYFLSAKKI